MKVKHVSMLYVLKPWGHDVSHHVAAGSADVLHHSLGILRNQKQHVPSDSLVLQNAAMNWNLDRTNQVYHPGY